MIARLEKRFAITSYSRQIPTSSKSIESKAKQFKRNVKIWRLRCRSGNLSCVKGLYRCSASLKDKNAIHKKMQLGSSCSIESFCSHILVAAWSVAATKYWLVATAQQSAAITNCLHKPWRRKWMMFYQVFA